MLLKGFAAELSSKSEPTAPLQRRVARFAYSSLATEPNTSPKPTVLQDLRSGPTPPIPVEFQWACLPNRTFAVRARLQRVNWLQLQAADRLDCAKRLPSAAQRPPGSDTRTTRSTEATGPEQPQSPPNLPPGCCRRPRPVPKRCATPPASQKTAGEPFRDRIDPDRTSTIRLTPRPHPRLRPKRPIRRDQFRCPPR